ncbi:MAG: hypothetical protein PVG20_00335 [Thioalkalispiraceae bacterium]|jgi:TPR repeat protein
MFNKDLVYKVGWLVTASSLGLTLASSIHAGTLHAGDVRIIAQADTTYAIKHVRDTNTRFRILRMSGEEALARGKYLIKHAKTRRHHLQAFEYLNYAAKQGLPEAQFQCAIMYLDDQYVPGNDERAMDLLEQASQQGHKQAEIALDYIRAGNDGGFGC